MASEILGRSVWKLHVVLIQYACGFSLGTLVYSHNSKNEHRLESTPHLMTSELSLQMLPEQSMKLDFDCSEINKKVPTFSRNWW